LPNSLFTKKRLEQSVEGAAGVSATRLVEMIRQDLFSFIDNAPQSDDITILAVKREES
jgi:serine phosphatase RsbU (regulator of sigma subunit)